MTPAQYLRDIEAAKAAQRQYALAHDRHAERVQIFRQFGRLSKELLAAEAAAIALRAWEAEWKDPSCDAS